MQKIAGSQLGFQKLATEREIHLFTAVNNNKTIPFFHHLSHHRFVLYRAGMVVLKDKE